MTEKSAEDFIPGLDELEEPPKSVVNLNINDTRIADAKALYGDVDASRNMPGAKTAAKVLQKMRATLTDAHKEQKADALEECRTLDAEKRRLLALIAEIEDPIRLQITEIETAEARKEQERVEAIESRMQTIRHHAEDIHDASLAELQVLQDGLAVIEIDDSFEEFREAAAGAKAEAESRLRIAINNRQATEEEAARLEQQRKGQEEQQAALDAQQANLDEQASKQQAEQYEHNRKAAEEADIKRQLEEKEAAEKQAELAEQQKEIDRQNREREEREERERVEKEAAEKEAAAARAAELAPDKEKLDKLADSLELQVLLPEVKSQQAEDVLTYVRSELKAIAVNVKHYAGEME